MLVQVSAADVLIRDSPDADSQEFIGLAVSDTAEVKGITQMNGINMIEFSWLILLVVVVDSGTDRDERDYGGLDEQK